MSPSPRRRPLSASTLVLGVVLALLSAVPASAVEDVTPARVEGPERAATAAAIAEQAFPEGTATAVIATAVAPFDALTATSLAGALDAAMLLVYPDRVPDVTLDALEVLGVTDLVLIGGPLSISPEVEDGLAERYDLIRRGGESQYDTAEIVSTETANLVGLPVVDGLRTVLLANGERFPDALAGSAAGFAGPTPVLYAETDDLREETRAYLGAHPVEQVVILGGTEAISEGVEAELEGSGRQVVRLGGVDRTDTATTVATWTALNYGFDLDAVMLARGDDFPDALTAGQLAGRDGRPLVLSATPDVLPEGVTAWLAARCEVIEVVQAVGGVAAVSTAVLEAAEDAAESCGAAGEPVGDDALPDFALDPLTAVYGLQDVDTVAATGLDGTTSLDVALFPCAAVAVDDDGSARFTDADGDGFADGYGVTETAFIVGINFVGMDQTRVVRGAEAEGDRLGIQVSAFDPDCAVVAVVPAQPGEGGIPVDADGRATVSYGVSVAQFGASATAQTYRVDPQQAVQGTVGEPQLLTVAGRYDGAAITASLDLVLFPCDGVDVLGEGPDTFADADADGAADGFGTTDSGAAGSGAVIVSVNGQPIEPTTVVVGVEPIEDAIEFQVVAEAADCTTPVVIDGNGNGQFDVDAEGRPVESYGVGRVSFS